MYVTTFKIIYKLIANMLKVRWFIRLDIIHEGIAFVLHVQTTSPVLQSCCSTRTLWL